MLSEALLSLSAAGRNPGDDCMEEPPGVCASSSSNPVDSCFANTAGDVVAGSCFTPRGEGTLAGAGSDPTGKPPDASSETTTFMLLWVRSELMERLRLLRRWSTSLPGNREPLDLRPLARFVARRRWDGALRDDGRDLRPTLMGAARPSELRLPRWLWCSSRVTNAALRPLALGMAPVMVSPSPSTRRPRKDCTLLLEPRRLLLVGRPSDKGGTPWLRRRDALGDVSESLNPSPNSWLVSDALLSRRACVKAVQSQRSNVSTRMAAVHPGTHYLDCGQSLAGSMSLQRRSAAEREGGSSQTAGRRLALQVAGYGAVVRSVVEVRGVRPPSIEASVRQRTHHQPRCACAGRSWCVQSRLPPSRQPESPLLVAAAAAQVGS